MKVFAQKPESFRPYTMTITIESLEEHCRLFEVFNCAPICDWIDSATEGGVSGELRNAMENGIDRPRDTYPGDGDYAHAFRELIAAWARQ